MTDRHLTPVAAPTKASEYERELHRYYESRFRAMETYQRELELEIRTLKETVRRVRKLRDEALRALTLAGGRPMLRRVKQAAKLD
jgi:C4-dicarboxylate-specific signal transduction histidine kinase